MIENIPVLYTRCIIKSDLRFYVAFHIEYHIYYIVHLCCLFYNTHLEKKSFKYTNKNSIKTNKLKIYKTIRLSNIYRSRIV